MDNIKNIEILVNESLSKHTTFRVGGNADYVIFPKSEESLKEVLIYLKNKKIPYIILGNGSNVLASDNGFKGAVIKLTKMIGITQVGDILTIKAGTSLANVGKYCLDNNLSGFETLCAIPGTIGGAVFMNAGAYGKEISDILISSNYLDENLDTQELLEHNFSYRHSFYTENLQYIITSATFRLKQAKTNEIKDIMENCKKLRLEKQPLELPSAGSTFKRPEGNFAGKLIEDAGLKGFSVGGAKVSEKHAGFVVNYNNATCLDILNLVKHIKLKVFEKENINLECEIRIIGD